MRNARDLRTWGLVFIGAIGVLAMVPGCRVLDRGEGSEALSLSETGESPERWQLAGRHICSRESVPIDQVLARRVTDLGTFRVRGSELRFGSIGDWGVVGSGSSDVDESRLRRLAKVMQSRARSSSWHFVANAGDNFYPSGLNSSHHPRWKASFEDVFQGSLEKLYWFGVLGNHDWEANKPDGFPLSQLQYSFRPDRVSKRWCIPYFYYSLRFELDDFVVRLIALDTQSMLHRCNNGCQTETVAVCAQERANRQFPTCDRFDPGFVRQRDFLIRNLKDAQEKGEKVLVLAHHFLAAVGNHGIQSGGNWGYVTIRDQLLPILNRYSNVVGYITGHEHSSEIHESEAGYLMVLAGRAGKMNGRLMCNPSDAADCQHKLDNHFGFRRFKFRYASLDEGFADWRLTKQSLDVRMVGLDGELVRVSA